MLENAPAHLCGQVRHCSTRYSDDAFVALGDDRRAARPGRRLLDNTVCARPGPFPSDGCCGPNRSIRTIDAGAEASNTPFEPSSAGVRTRISLCRCSRTTS